MLLAPPARRRRLKANAENTVSREVQTTSDNRLPDLNAMHNNDDDNPSEMHSTPQGPSPDSAPVTPRKRARSNANDAPVTPKSNDKPAIPFQSPSGPRVIHINTDDYVPHENDIVVEPWVSKRTSEYLYKFVNYYNPDGHRFPIHRVPTPLRWAVVDENPRWMHVVHLDRPLLIWFVVTLVDASLVTTRAFPTPRLRVVGDFVRERDRREAIALYNKAGGTSITRLETLIVCAPANDNEGPQTYDQVYDATQRFEDKANMKNITQAKIQSGDIVLLECTLVLCEGDRPGAKSLSYMLNTLYWLAEKPKPTKAPVLYEERPFPDVIAM